MTNPIGGTYYLDTSAIRSLGKRLITLSEKYDFCSSVLAIIELIAGIQEEPNADKDYLNRRGSILNICNSKLRIIQKLPYEILDLAFSYDNNGNEYDKQRNDLSAIIDEIYHCENHNLFFSNLQDKRLYDSFRYFCELDQHISKTFASIDYDMLKQGLEQQRQSESNTFSELELKNLKSVGKSLLSKEKIDLIYSVILMGLASVTTRIDHKDPQIDQYFDAYNNSIEFFVNAMMFNQSKEIENQSTPGRNDGIDLYHFLYIDESFTLISDDNKQIELYEKTGSLLEVELRGVRTAQID